VYNYGLDLISQRTLSPQLSTNYFIYDGHGSTRLLADSGGNVVNAFAYDACGTLIASNTSPQTAYLYAGQQFDSDLGFYYLRARYLNPNTGRFWTMDTDEGNNQDPLSLHKYLYCQANPVIGTDPSGHQDMISLMISLAIGEDLDADEDVVDVGVDVAFTAHIVDIYVCAKLQAFRVPLHAWVYAKQPVSGTRFDIGAYKINGTIFTGTPGFLRVSSASYSDVKKDANLYFKKWASLNEIQFMEWSVANVGDAALIGLFDDSLMYSKTYALFAGIPSSVLDMPDVVNCVTFSITSGLAAKAIAKTGSM
jgi:RHS repeat-associated protein